MMFEMISQKLHQKISDHGIAVSAQDEFELMPVTSIEEVAIQLKNDDDENKYEYFLLQVTRPKGALPPKPVSGRMVVPPPFTGVRLPASMTAAAAMTTPIVATAPVAPIPASPISTPDTISAGASSQETATPRNSALARPDKDDVPFLVENADLLFKSGETNLARNIYRAILKTGEASEVAYAGLASCADRDGLVDQAIQFAWDSVAFAPNQKGYQLLAQLLVQQGRDHEAAQALQRAIKLLPDLSALHKAEYYKMIGNCQSRLGLTTDSERSYKKALELSPASDEVQSNLGSLYLEQGQVAEAKRCYQDAIAANPNNDKAWVGLGLCHVTEGDKESAHDAFAKSLEKNIRNSTSIFHLVKCAYEIKRYTTAEKILSQYVEVAPVSPSLLYSLAGLQFHVGKKDFALTTAKRILQMKADHSGAKDLIQRISAN